MRGLRGWGVAVGGKRDGVEFAVLVGERLREARVGVHVDVADEEGRCPGISSSCPMEIKSLVRLFSSIMASTVVLNLRAIPPRVSPATTV